MDGFKDQEEGEELLLLHGDGYLHHEEFIPNWKFYLAFFVSHPVSILGSLYILKSILRDPIQRSMMRNQIMMALSTSDIVYSTMGLLGLVAALEGEYPFMVFDLGLYLFLQKDMNECDYSLLNFWQTPRKLETSPW